MAHAGQNPTNAVSTSVAAVAKATQVTVPVVRPPATAAPTAAPPMIRAARSQVGRLRFKKNMFKPLFEVDDQYLEAAPIQKGSGFLKKIAGL
jgi:hypothetical protein